MLRIKEAKEVNIVARGRRNEFGSNWWSKRWNKSLSRFTISSRLQRGKTYAREGYVRNIDISKGEIQAEVQGSMSSPYKVSIIVNKFPMDIWNKVIKIMARKAIFSAKLLNGEIPENIEAVFEYAGVSLFPKNDMDLITSCSCLDFANPCKHIAAVYYMIGLEFDKDPFMIFKLRGMDKDKILKALRRARSGGKKKKEKVKNHKETVKSLEDFQREFEEFNGIEEDVLKMEFSYEKPEEEYGIIKKLGVPEFCTITDNFEYKMKEAYYNTAEEVKKYL